MRCRSACIVVAYTSSKALATIKAIGHAGFLGLLGMGCTSMILVWIIITWIAGERKEKLRIADRILAHSEATELAAGVPFPPIPASGNLVSLAGFCRNFENLRERFYSYAFFYGFAIYFPIAEY